MSSKVKIIFITVFFILFLFPSQAKALSFQITGVNPGEITSRDDEIQVNLSITGLSSNSYFRVALQKSSGSDYFGYLKVGENWVKIMPLSTAQYCLNYYPISETASASATLTLKVGDNNYDNGIYRLKAHRFTSGCSYNASDETQDFAVNMSLPTPTPSPTPDHTAAPTSNPTSTSSPTPTPVKIPTPTPKKSPTPSPTVGPIASDSATNQPEVQGIKDEMNLLGVASESAGITGKKGPPIIPIILISCGGIFIIGAGLALAKKGKSEYNLKDNESVTQNN